MPKRLPALLLATILAAGFALPALGSIGDTSAPKTTNNQTTIHVWDGSNISLDITDGDTVKYIRGIGLIATDAGIFYLFDGGGSVIQLTDSTGNVVREYDYDAFGNERIQVIHYGDVDGDGVIDAADVALLRAFIAAVCRDEFTTIFHWFNIRNADVNGDGVIDDADVLLLRQYLASSNKANFHMGPPLSEDGNPWRYRGEYLDFCSGLYYLRARSYSSVLGRFVSEDPWWGVHNMQDDLLAIRQSSNLYVYTMNNPIRFIDPTGLAVWLIHGTWSDKSTWTQDFRDWIVGEKGAFAGEDLFFGDWGGRNTRGSRQAGADAILAEILRFHQNNPDEPIRLVGHSHGGNVGILVANMLAEKGIKVDTLITIGTPVRNDYQLNRGVTVGQHINVFNRGDVIQHSGGGFDSTIFAFRQFRGATNVRTHHYQNWLGMNKGVYNHSFMHSSTSVWRRYVVPAIN
jgi:RHS repeat-associated protein